MIETTHKTFELDKPGWIAALMDAHKRKERKNTLWLKHLRKPEKSNKRKLNRTLKTRE